jgi:glycosyltransferase involved in cell wall biosynthesis
VLTCGRLIPAKGQEALLRAFAAIADEVPDARLIILGEGPLRGRLESLRAHYGLEGRVFLPGFQQNPHAWVQRSTVFVLPSRTEGFPNALLEAMLLGRPVIATDCPSGPRELLDPDSNPNEKTSTLQFAPFGILTPPLETKENGDDAPLSHAEQALAKGLKALLTDTTLREEYAAKAEERAQLFDYEAVLNEWLTLIEHHIGHSEAGRLAREPAPWSRHEDN